MAGCGSFNLRLVRLVPLNPERAGTVRRLRGHHHRAGAGPARKWSATVRAADDLRPRLRAALRSDLVCHARGLPAVCQREDPRADQPQPQCLRDLVDALRLRHVAAICAIAGSDPGGRQGHRRAVCLARGKLDGDRRPAADSGPRQSDLGWFGGDGEPARDANGAGFSSAPR